MLQRPPRVVARRLQSGYSFLEILWLLTATTFVYGGLDELAKPGLSLAVYTGGAFIVITASCACVWIGYVFARIVHIRLSKHNASGDTRPAGTLVDGFIVFLMVAVSFVAFFIELRLIKLYLDLCAG